MRRLFCTSQPPHVASYIPIQRMEEFCPAPIGLIVASILIYAEHMALLNPTRRISEAEYLEMESAADFKSEFYDGEMFAMSGGTRWHSIITSNLNRELGNCLEGRGCIVFDSNMRVKVEATGLYTYPDASITCEEQRYLEGETDTLLNPAFIAEVLSDSTERYDRGEKFVHYQKIPSLTELLFVNQHTPRLELFVRQKAGTWVLHQAAGLEAKLISPTLGITLNLARIYANVEFEPRLAKDPNQRPR